MSQTQTEHCFQLKGSNVTSIVLELNRYPASEFLPQLLEKVEQAPQFFQQSAIVISLERLESAEIPCDLRPLIDDCRKAGLQPMAFKGGDSSYSEAITATGLPSLPASSGRNELLDLSSKSSGEARAVVERVVETRIETIIEEKLVQRPSKVIDKPVRGGQQIYAEGADLIVLAQVSEGAEVLADGHIHIYAPLRGRALAGVKGDQTARIFCQQLEAELVSIAGVFMLSEELKDKAWKKAAQVYFSEEQLNIASLI
jgi:septum site-determining protein MinC